MVIENELSDAENDSDIFSSGSSSNDSDGSTDSTMSAQSESDNDSERLVYNPSIKAILKRQLRKELRKMEAKRSKRKSKRRVDRKTARLTRNFRVPKNHPIFSMPNGVQKWIDEMELFHEDYTTGIMEHTPNPNFISKLIMYFTDDWGARSWFQLYAKEAREKGEELTWFNLKEALRKRYLSFDEPRLRFEEYLDICQHGDVKRYIAKKAEAAGQCKGLSDEVKLYIFIRGLKKEFKAYVNLQRPENLEAAQDSAIAFENSRSGTGKRGVTFETESGTVGGTADTSRKRSAGTVLEKGDEKVLKRTRTSEQKKALADLRALTAKDKQNCWGCGLPGHSKRECEEKSTAEQRSQFKAKKDALKEIINGKQ